jgi:hypothetical protein
MSKKSGHWKSREKHEFMRVVIAGATGFIGKALCRELHKDYQITALSRDADKARRSLGQIAGTVQWDAKAPYGWAGAVDGATAVVNLAGESIAAGRWNAAKKRRILHSRLDAITAIIEAIRQADTKPKVLVQASATGYYGPQQDEQLDEESRPGHGFLATVCQSVENSAMKVEHLGVRCVLVRSGVVLGRREGALPKIAKPFRYYLGGHPGSGRQWFSWISLDDEIAAIRFLMESENLHGAFNLTAPEPVTMKQFCKTLGQVLHRPAWFAVPGLVLRLVFGQMAQETVLSGQRVLPKRLLQAGFHFEHATVQCALDDILTGKDDYEPG